jgi:hypothetical protein
MMHTSRHHALDRAQHLYRLPQVRVGALALGGFLVGLLMSLQQSLIGYTHHADNHHHPIPAHHVDGLCHRRCRMV